MITVADLVVGSLWYDDKFKSKIPYVAKITSISDYLINFVLPNSLNPMAVYSDNPNSFIVRWKPFKDTSVSEYIL